MADSTFLGFGDENLPFSTEAEQSVIGAILIDPESILLVADTLKPYHFYVPQHKTIYEALTNMFELNRTIDFVTLLEWLKKKGVYEDVGGKAYLTQLAHCRIIGFNREIFWKKKVPRISVRNVDKLSFFALYLNVCS